MPSAARTRRFPWIRTLLVVLLSCLTTWVVACVQFNRAWYVLSRLRFDEMKFRYDQPTERTFAGAAATRPLVLPNSLELREDGSNFGARFDSHTLGVDTHTLEVSWPNDAGDQGFRRGRVAWSTAGIPLPSFDQATWGVSVVAGSPADVLMRDDPALSQTIAPSPQHGAIFDTSKTWPTFVWRKGRFDTGVPALYGQPLIILTRPLPLGFTLNSLIAAPLWIAILFGPGWMRRIIRSRRGQCTACGYDIEQLATCPECGTARVKTPPPSGVA